MGNGLIILDRENAGGENSMHLRQNMLYHMRNNYRNGSDVNYKDESKEAYKKGYEEGYKDACEDCEKDMQASEQYRRGRDSMGRFT